MQQVDVDRIERAYRDAWYDWEIHKDGCTICGTFGEPTGCEHGSMLWTALHAAAMARRDLKSGDDMEVSP